MVASIVQRQSAQAAVNTQVQATVSTPSVGNRLIAIMKENGPNAVTPPTGFSHATGSPYLAGTTRSLNVFYKDADGTEGTLTFSNADTNNKLLTVWEVAGADLSVAPIVTTTTNAAGVTSKALTATATLPKASCFAAAVAEQALDNGGSEALSVASGYTIRDTGTFTFWAIADQITTATTALAPTFTWTTARASFGLQVVQPAADVTMAAPLSVTATIAAAMTRTQNADATLDITATTTATASKTKAAGATLGVTASIFAQMDRVAAPLAAPPDEFPSVSVWEPLGSNVFGLVGSIASYDALNFEPRFLDPGQWEMTVSWDENDDDARVLSQVTPDRYFTIDWRGVRTTWVIEDWGPSQDAEGKNTLVVGGPGALSVLGREEAWPVPGDPLGSQPDVEITPGDLYGPDDAETVIRDLITDNYVTRAGNDLAAASSSGSTHLGGTIRARGKWDNLLELVTKKAKRGGIGVDVGLVNLSTTRAELRLRVWEPTDRSNRVNLSEELGTVSGWEQKNTAPTATKARVSGAGGTHQVVTTPESEAAAALWGGHRVVVVPLPDAYDADDQLEAGKEALDEGAATTNVSLTGTDSEGLTAFTHYTYGDQVTGTLSSGLDVVDIVSGIKVDVTDSYPQVTATFGDPDATDPLVSMAVLIRNHNRRLRQVEQRS